MADPKLCTFVDQSVADLLGGPAIFNALNDLISKLWMPDQLALAGAPIGGLPMRSGAVVAIIARQALIPEPVPLDLAIDGGFRALKHAGDLPNRDFRELPTFDPDTVLDARLRVNRSPLGTLLRKALPGNAWQTLSIR